MAAVTYTENGQVVLDQKVTLGEQYLASYTISPASGPSLATASSHILQIMAGASLNVRIRRIEIFQAAPATTATIATIGLYRLSSAGTGGTSITPSPLDPSSAPAGATAMSLPSAKGAEGALLSLSTMATFQALSSTFPTPMPSIVWDFDGRRSTSLIIPSGVSSGLAIKNISAIASAVVTITVWMTETSF